MYCSQCGKQNSEGSRFCHSCGTALFAGISPDSENIAATPVNRKPLQAKVGLGNQEALTSSGSAEQAPSARYQATAANYEASPNGRQMQSAGSNFSRFRNIEVIGSVGMLVAFFLPWFSVGGLVSVTGFEVPNAISSLMRVAQALEQGLSGDAVNNFDSALISYVRLVYLPPILATVAIVLAFIKRETFLAGFFGGMVFLCLVVFVFIKLHPVKPEVADALSIGFYLSVLMAILCVLSAARSRDEHVPPYAREISKDFSAPPPNRRKAYWEE